MWQRSKVPSRVTVLTMGLVLVFAAIEIRLIQIQVFGTSRFRKAAKSQQETLIKLNPKRSPIYDRNGRPLALSVGVDSVYADPSKVPNKGRAASQLARALGLRARDVRAKLRNGKRFAWIDRKITPSERKRVQKLRIPGIGFYPESKRYYPKGTLAAHVLGYAGIDNQGLDGIEYFLDDQVRGKAGFLVALRDGKGSHPLRFKERPPTAGRAAVLSLDEVIQHLAERELDRAVRKHHAEGGTVIVLRPQTGEILAMANRPTFDPNSYTRYPELSRRNRAIGSIYEPGSTFKILTTGLALEEKKVTPRTVINCENGSIRIGKHRIKEDRIPYDYLSVAQVLEKSSNVGAVKLAMMLDPQTYYRHLSRFGFGQATGVDLPGEENGILREPSSWSGLSQASLAIGQEVGVTPIQLLTAVAAVANGGVRRAPWVVAGLMDEDGSIARTPQSLQKGERVISEKTAASLTSMMERVVMDGTGKMAAIHGYPVAGKTGTAQKMDPATGRYSRGKYVASFVGFVPSSDPELAILAVVDEPHNGFHGGSVAGPVFANVALPALQHLGVVPDEGGVTLDRGTEIRASLEQLDSLPSPRNTERAGGSGHRAQLASMAHAGSDPEDDRMGKMPDLTHLDLRDAVLMATRAGLVPRVSGKGPVVRKQSIHPGTVIAPGETCTFTLGEVRR